MTTLGNTILCLALGFGLAAGYTTLVELALNLGATELVHYLNVSDLTGMLINTGNYTIFGPTNAAFSALPSRVRHALDTDTDFCGKVMKYHLTHGDFYSSQFSNDKLVPTLDPGIDVRVNVYKTAGDTVVTLSGSKVTGADQNASNGVIHLVDRVLFPLPTGTIPVLLTHRGDMGTLLFAIVQATLVDKLNSMGPLTMFAPTDAAFQKIPAGVWNLILQNETAIIELVENHVISGADYSKGLTNTTVTALSGRQLTITVTAGSVSVNGHQVTEEDQTAANGVVHVINDVLLPSYT